MKFADWEKPEHRFPRSVGYQKNLYIRNRGGVEDDDYEDFFGKIENEYAKLRERVNTEQNQLCDLTGKELGALLAFLASQAPRTLANRVCMDEQVGHSVDTNTFLHEMAKQMAEIYRSWKTDPPSFQFYTSLPYVEERLITGDNPVLVVVDNGNTIWVPRDEPTQRITSPQYLLSSPNTSFRVALSSHICVVLRVHGAGETRLPPQTMEPMQVRWFNARIREQCRLFVLARDETSLM